MRFYRTAGEIPASPGQSVVVIGKFDGVHLGHQAMIATARQRAHAHAAQVVAVTFDRNPLSVLRPDIAPESVIGNSQKLHLLEQAGVDITLMLTFDRDLAALAPRDFVEQVLVGSLDVALVLVGRDFRFGHLGVGTVDSLAALGREFGFAVEVIGDITDDAGRISSTLIREALSHGDVTAAGALLGRLPEVRGTVVRGHQRGRELGFPTANIAGEGEGFVPADGVYAGYLVDQPGTAGALRYPAAISIGTNPTFDDVSARTIEAYVLGRRDLELYDHHVAVEFVERLRPMHAFATTDELIEQMRVDVSRAERALSDR